MLPITTWEEPTKVAMDNNLDMGTEYDPEVLEGDQHLQGDDIIS